MEVAPIVSVVIPTLDRPKLLREAIRSAVSQSYRRLEIIVQDNGRDGSLDRIIEESNDSRIKLCRIHNKVRMSENWKHGALRATGRYLAFLSDDDFWEPNYIEKMVVILEHEPSLVLAFCDHWIVDASGELDLRQTERNSKRWCRDVLAEGRHHKFGEIAVVRQSIWTASATVFRRDAIDWSTIPEQSGVGVDLHLAYMGSRTERPAWYLKERLAYYRLHRGSTTSSFAHLTNKVECSRDAIFNWSTFASDERLKQFRPYFRKKIAKNIMRLIVSRALLGEFPSEMRTLSNLWKSDWVENCAQRIAGPA
jgi:glycosyltransferase involved in cell wall biosynthesis